MSVKLEVDSLEELRTKLECLEKQKKELLEHYSSRTPKLFFQYDGFVVGKDCDDDIMRPDPDGDWLSSGRTYELMHGADVRLLINPETSKEETLRLIAKLAKWVEADGFDNLNEPQSF